MLKPDIRLELSVLPYSEEIHLVSFFFFLAWRGFIIHS